MGNGVHDEFYQEAVDLVVRMQQVSVSMLQRRFRIGYTRAAKMVDVMEEEGIVSASDHHRPRKVLRANDPDDGQGLPPPDPDKPQCGAKTRAGRPCKKPAGWGTDHAGSGRCKLHGGSSTGPRTEEGKAKAALNSRKHGAYIDKVLNEDEKEIYDYLYESTIKKYILERENPIHMSLLHRACVTYLKLLRLDKWEMDREFEPYLDPSGAKDDYGNPLIKPKKVYDVNGEVVGEKMGEVREIRWSKNTPPWDTHFMNYIKLLGTDRASQLKREDDGNTAQKVVDGFAWLWGQKSKEE